MGVCIYEGVNYSICMLKHVSYKVAFTFVSLKGLVGHSCM